MEITSFKEIGVAAWDAFCNESPDAWLWHTSGGIGLGCAFRDNCTNLSFGLMSHGSLIAVVPLIVENIAGTKQKEFAMDGTPLPFPALKGTLSDEEKKKALKLIFVEVDRRARTEEIVRGSFSVDPLAESSAARLENPLLSFGFDDDSIKTSLIDLKKNEKDLFSHISKAHRADIRSAELKEFSVEFYMNDTISTDIFGTCKNLYFAAAGKEVGNPARWEKTRHLFKQGNMVLAFGRPGNSAEYGTTLAVLCYKNRAYYALSGLLPELRRSARGLGHLIQWETIKYLKAHGYEAYELGWQISDTDEKATSKERTISEFKARFGGNLVPLWRGEKRYQ